MCQGLGTTWGPARGPGGRALPGLVGILERGVQLLEALLQRVALVVLHQLLQDTPTDCRRLQAGLPGSPAALCRLLRFTLGTSLLGPQEPPSSSSPSTRPRAGGRHPKTFEPLLPLPNVSKGKAMKCRGRGQECSLQLYTEASGNATSPAPGKCFQKQQLVQWPGPRGHQPGKGGWTGWHTFHYTCPRAGRARHSPPSGSA